MEVSHIELFFEELLLKFKGKEAEGLLSAS